MIKNVLWIWLLFLPSFLFAQFTVPPHQGYITDEAHVLSDADKSALTEKISSFLTATSAEIAILLVPTLNNDLPAMVATAVWQERWVGKKEQDNGIVILIAVEDRERFIAVGYGLEWTIPDAIAKRIGERNFPDRFRQEDYAGWLSAVLDDMAGYVQADPSVVSWYQNNEQFDDSNFFASALFFSIAFLFILWLQKKKTVRSKAITTSIRIFVVIWFGLIGGFLISLTIISLFSLFFVVKIWPIGFMWWRWWFGWGSWWFWWFGWFGWGWFGWGGGGGRW